MFGCIWRDVELYLALPRVRSPEADPWGRETRDVGTGYSDVMIIELGRDLLMVDLAAQWIPERLAEIH